MASCCSHCFCNGGQHHDIINCFTNTAKPLSGQSVPGQFESQKLDPLLKRTLLRSAHMPLGFKPTGSWLLLPFCEFCYCCLFMRGGSQFTHMSLSSRPCIFRKHN